MQAIIFIYKDIPNNAFIPAKLLFEITVYNLLKKNISIKFVCKLLYLGVANSTTKI